MSQRESNILAFSFIGVFGIMLLAFFYQQAQIRANTDKIDFVLKMDSVYQGKGRTFMTIIYLRQDSALRNHEIMIRNQDSIIKLLKHK